MVRNKLIITTALITLLFLNYSCSNSVEKIEDPATGIVLKQYEYYLDDDGQKVKDGEFKEWYKSGDIRLEQNYKDGILEGESVFHVSSDSIYYNYFKNGLKSGVCKFVNSKGEIFGTYSYANGKLNGESVYYNSNGKKYLKAEYKDDLPVGKWNYFDENESNAGVFHMENHLPKELIGKWKVKDQRLTYFVFNDDASFSVLEPYNKYARKPYESIVGTIVFGASLRLKYGNSAFGGEMVFDIIKIEDDKIELFNYNSLEMYHLSREKV